MRWFATAVLVGLAAGCASTPERHEPSKHEPGESATAPAAPVPAVTPPPAAGSGGNAAGDPGPGDQPLLGLPDVVAEMDGHKITREEFLRNAVEWFGRETVEEMVLRYVFDCGVRDTGASVTEKELDARVEKEIQDREKQLKASGKPPLAQVLAQMGKTVDQLRTEMKANDDMKRQVLLEYMLAYSYYTEPNVKVAVIFVRDVGKAEKLRKQVKEGADFSKLVETESEDTASSKGNGELPPFIQGMSSLGAEFEDAAFALQDPGALSPVVKTDAGYFLIRLVKKDQANPQTFESLRDRIEKATMEKQALNLYMKRLRARYVKGLKYAVPALEPKKK
ncbi:MAG: peptidylprolyl isomerase [Planctomycetes bacterium]|nr:peptidylprolyl isomerase [Planctomycetota bacterium]